MGLIGTILGDIAGSQYEFSKPDCIGILPLFTSESEFTDDTVLAIATKYAIDNSVPFDKAYQRFAIAYPFRGYGRHFETWVFSENPQPYGSYGNGSAMRVAYVADKFNTEKEVLEIAKESAIVTHNHPEGIKGAQTTAMCSYMARTGATKIEIKNYIVNNYGNYYFDTPLKELQKRYKWNGSCQHSVPLAIRCFLESENYIDFLYKVLSFNCDADTICAIGGCVTENYYKTTGLSEDILETFLDTQLLSILKRN